MVAAPVVTLESSLLGKSAEGTTLAYARAKELSAVSAAHQGAVGTPIQRKGPEIPEGLAPIAEQNQRVQKAVRSRAKVFSLFH